MLMLAISAALIGAMLGTRFKVLVLLPATIISLAVTFGIGTARSDGFLPILLTMALVIAALQLGYFTGAGGVAASRIDKNSQTTVMAAHRPTS